MAEKKNYYAVRNGRNPGIYLTWDECKREVIGYSGAEYKGFVTKEEAIEFLGAKKEDDGVVSDCFAYVDGSFSLETLKFSFGAVIFYDGEEHHFNGAFSDPEMVTMRNVAGEIMGATFAMQYCLDNNIKSIDIYYDYQGVEKWCTGEWKTNKAGTVRYAEFYKSVSKSVDVHFVKVKGHSGVKYNDLADKLAKEALGIE